MGRILLLLVSILAFLSPDVPAVQMAGDKAAGQQVLQAFEGWVAAYDKGDLEGTMAIFAPGVVFTFQGGKDQGYDDLRKGYVQDFSARKPGTTWVPQLEEVYVEGTIAIVRSTWELRVKSATGEALVRARNRSVDILSRGSGAWRIIRSFNYPEK